MAFRQTLAAYLPNSLGCRAAVRDLASELASLRSVVLLGETMKLALALLLILCPVGAVVAASPADVQAAVADYNSDPVQQFRYLDLADLSHVAAVKYCVVSVSREPLLDRTVPTLLPGTKLLRISLAQLRWKEQDWITLFAAPRNGYSDPAHKNPLIVHAGFFVATVMDQTASDGYLRLLHDRQPKTVDEFYQAWGIDPKKQGGLAFGLIEGQSGINVAKTAARFLRHDDGINAEAWTTLDVKRVQPGSNPLETLDDSFKADGTEVFILRTVVSTNGVRGLMPVTALANAAGTLVAEAPADLVVDHSRAGGLVTVRNPISCATCHTSGSQRPTENALRARLESGVELLAKDYDKQTKAELFHLGEVNSSFDRWDEGYAAALGAINGLSPEQNATAVAACFNAYHRDVSLDVAAMELDSDPKELALALGYASLQKIELGPGLAALAHGVPMQRSDFEHSYLRAKGVLQVWRKQ